MTEQFDIVIAGAGHNSLITAAYLAQAGFSCLMLEARPVIGGNTMTEELTLPGFLHDTCSTTHSIFMESPIWRGAIRSCLLLNVDWRILWPILLPMSSFQMDPTSHS